MSAIFRIVIFFLGLGLVSGCNSVKYYPIDTICVINAVTLQREPDVLIAFTDNRSGKVIYAKTMANGLALLPGITKSGSYNPNDFKYELGKPGFEPGMFCDYHYPEGVLPPGKNSSSPYSVFCIVPIGTDRSKLKHKHRYDDLTNVFMIPKESQSELKQQWETLQHDCTPVN